MELLIIILLVVLLLLVVLFIYRALSAKRKSARGISFAPYSAADVDNFDWPSFFAPNEVRLLAQRVRQAATDEYEHRLFPALLRRAYEDSLELQILYRELPGVLKNDHAAINNFRGVLDRAARHGVGVRYAAPRATAPRPRNLIGYQPLPDSLDNRWCRPVSFIGLDRVLLIAQGANHISRGDAATYRIYADTLRGLWQQTQPLELLYRFAVEATGPDGRDRLAEHLRLDGRDSRIDAGGARLPGRDVLGGDVPGIIHGGVRRDFIARSLPPDDLWPPRGGGRVTWPDGGGWPVGPERFPTDYRDYCYFIEPCLDQALDGIGEVILAGHSAHANGITSVSPARACAGQAVTIHGTSFGDTQPSETVVVIGGMQAEVLSWSDTAIQIKVPPNATSGCVGFLYTGPTVEGVAVRGTTFDDVAIGVSRCSGHSGKLVQPTAGDDEPGPPARASTCCWSAPRRSNFPSTARQT